MEMIKRRFLFSSTSGYGHFHPLIPLAKALKEAGHSVAFAMSSTRKDLIENEDFAFFTVDRSVKDDPEYRQIREQLKIMPLNLEYELFAYPRLFCGVSTRASMPELLKVVRQWQPDMLIREAGEYSAVIAAEHFGLPHAVVAFTAALEGQAIFEREAAAFLDPVRKQWGLKPDSTLSSLYRYLHLSYSPPAFSLRQVADSTGTIPPTTHFIRPQFYDRSLNETLPDWVARMPEQPTVYITLGTEVNKEPEFYPRVLKTIIEGLRMTPFNLIMTVGTDKDPADFGEQPPNVHIEKYIPQSQLLDHCDLMVMHGGSNSLLAAIDREIPAVIVPLIADQFFNASIVQQLQLGQVIQLQELTPMSIQVAVMETLNNPLYRQNLSRLRSEMYSLPDQQHAVELIERLVAEKTPILNPVIPDKIKSVKEKLT
jgi:UDP:flavonoid glycosyltransferase YjiC (YdhE family)